MRRRRPALLVVKISGHISKLSPTRHLSLGAVHKSEFFLHRSGHIANETGWLAVLAIGEVNSSTTSICHAAGSMGPSSSSGTPENMGRPGLLDIHLRLNPVVTADARPLSDDSQILEGPSFGHKPKPRWRCLTQGRQVGFAVFSRRSFEANPHSRSSSIASQSAAVAPTSCSMRGGSRRI
jgi:hypothetical protein